MTTIGIHANLCLVERIAYTNIRIQTRVYDTTTWCSHSIGHITDLASTYRYDTGSKFKKQKDANKPNLVLMLQELHMRPVH